MGRLARFIRFYTEEDDGNGGGKGVLKTVTGALLHVVDALAKPAKKFVATLEPIQDLHGQDAPYPSGGGVNILDPNLKFTAGTYYGGAVLSTTDGYNITFSGTPTESGNITTNNIPTADAIVMPAGTYTSVGATLSTYKADGSWYTNRAIGTWTADEAFIVRQAYIQAVAGSPITGSRFIALAKGSTAPTAWSPYSNICPITGHTGVEVYHSGADTSDPTTIPITFPVLGKNLLDMSDANIEVGKYIDNSGAEKTNGSNFYNSVYIPVKASTAYTLGTSSGIKYCSFMEYDENKTFIKRTLYGNGSTPFTTQSHTMGSTTAFVLIGSNPTGSTIDLDDVKSINWMFNEGSTAETYEPYTSTVYGGTLTNEDGEWKLEVTHKTTTVDGTSLKVDGIYGDGTAYTSALEDIYDDGSYARQREILVQCDKLKGVAYINHAANPYTISQNGGKRLILNLPDLSTASAFNTWLQANNLQVLYELATPIEYTLTESQALTLLKGENNIWVDDSDSLELQYYAKVEETTP